MPLALSLALLLATEGLPPASQDKRAQLQLVVNGADLGLKIILLRGEEILVRESDLSEAGMRSSSFPEEKVGEIIYVPLSQLADCRTELDAASLTVRVQADARYFAGTTIDLSESSRPPGLIVSRTPSAFLNYALEVNTNRDVGGTAELGASFSGNLLMSSVSALPGEGAVRGFTSLTSDKPEDLRRMIFGDQVASTGVLGGAATVAGFSISREFSLDPYFSRYQLPKLTGSTTTPSTLEIYVNNVLVKKETLPPGVYSLSNLPVSNGAGTVRTVLRDAFGEQVSMTPYYFTNGLLSKGLSDYSYVVGAVRNDLGTSSFSYGDPVAMGRYRRGFADWVTAGGRLEAGVDRVSGGPSGDFLVPYGDVQLDLAGSRQGAYGGTAASLAFTTMTRTFSFSADVRTESRFYATASQNALDDRARLETNVIASIPIASRLSLNGEYSASLYRDKGLSDQLSGSAQLSVSQGASIVFTLGYSRQQTAPPALNAMLLFVYAFGRNTSASIAGEQAGQQHAIAQVQKNLPLGTGYGFEMQTDVSQSQTQTQGLFQAQNEYGRVELDYQHQIGNDLSSATLSGGIVAMGGHLFATRPVQDSYALIQVPGVEGVHGFFENQPMGSTNRNGDLLVPNLVSYYGGNLRISTDDLPLGYSFDSSTIIAQPGFRSGALARFAVQRVQSARGTVQVSSGGRDIVVAYGQLTLTVNGLEVVSPIGADGAFYFENLPTGTFPARIEMIQGECNFELKVAASADTVTKLGVQHCAMKPVTRELVTR